MPVCRDQIGRWRYRLWVDLPDGTKTRLTGSAPKIDNTKQAAMEAEREHVHRVLNPAPLAPPAPPKKEVPTFLEFMPEFEAYARANNKPSEVASKRNVLKRHLVPTFGKLRLDEIGEREIERFKTKQLDLKLSKKTVNNHLSCLRRMLVMARRFKLITVLPEIIWMKAPKSEFDFLSFEEAERLTAAADGEWKTMLLVALRTGLRHGELLGLRWEDVDLVAGKLLVRQSIVLGIVGTPKSGRSREVALSEQAVAALKGHRHLRGELVFCKMDGRALARSECKWPLWRAAQRAGLRRIGWHVLRHTFASHLTMRGVPLKAVQELLGHATIEMTMRYAHLSPNVRRDAVRTLDEPAVVSGIG